MTQLNNFQSEERHQGKASLNKSMKSGIYGSQPVSSTEATPSKRET
jgi:hypothetical protein